MAITVLTATTQSVAINYNYSTSGSTDWTSVPNSTYFYDLVDKLPHYKNSTGSVLEVFSTDSSGTSFTGGTVTGSTNFTNGLTANTFSSTTIYGTNLFVTGGTQSLFSGDSSSEMVRIIQNGSGDAFVVEDQANGDSSHFVINGSGNTAIGLTAPLGNDKLTVSGNTTIYGTLSATTVNGDGSGLTNLPTPYGLITAISTGNYLI